MNQPTCVMLVAAEASGDLLGADLARALRDKLHGAVRFVGVGGPRMAGEGVVSPFPIDQLSILGLLEGVRAYPRVLRRVRETVELARRERPDIAVLIDSWGFTLRLAQGLRRLDSKLALVKYVGPQVWASRPGRARVLARTVDRLLTIHPFDAPLFERAGLPTTFVGNSSLVRRSPAGEPERLRRRIGAGDSDPILLVAPGSRPGEVARLLAPFEAAVSILKSHRPDLRIVIPAAPTVATQVREGVASWPGEPWVLEGDQDKADAVAAATVALACSGSFTTELALAGCPVVVAYRLSPLTHAILRRVMRTDYITLLNIAAGRMIAPEFIQGNCTGERLAHGLEPLLDDPDLRARQISDQAGALELMGRRDDADPAVSAAGVVIEMLVERGLV